MNTKEQLIVIAEICRQDLKLLVSRNNLQRLSRDSEQAKMAAGDLANSINGLTESKAEALKRRKLLDEKLQIEKSNLRKWESRAEKIKGEREYTALMSEISSQKRTIAGIESEIADIMSELKSSDENLLKATGAREEKIDSASNAFEAVKDLLKAEEDRLAQHSHAKEALMTKIPATLQARYLRIYDKRAQQAIAFLKNEVCQACQRKVPPEFFIRVAKMEVIEQCPSCQRILVVDLAIDETT